MAVGPSVGLVGQLRTAGETSYCDDSGPVLPLFLHAGDLLCVDAWGGREADVEHAFDVTAQAGYHGWRTWATLNWAARPDSWWAPRYVGPGVTDDYRGRLRRHLDRGFSRGLVAHLSVGDIKYASDQQEDDLYGLLRDVVTEYGVEHFVMPGEVNEARDTGDEDDREPGEIRDLVEIIRGRHPEVLYALSAFTGHEELDLIKAWTPAWMRFAYYHAYRGGNISDKIRHAFSFPYEVLGGFRRLVWDGEGPGFGPWVSAADHKEELDTEGMGALCAMKWIARTAVTLMSSQGVIFDEPFEVIPGFATIPQLRDRLPRDVMQFETLHHSGQSKVGTRVLVAGGEYDRVDGAIAHDGRFAYVLHGTPGEHRHRVERGFEGVVIDPGTLQETPVALRVGQELRVSYQRGRVLVGKLV